VLERLGMLDKLKGVGEFSIDPKFGGVNKLKWQFIDHRVAVIHLKIGLIGGHVCFMKLIK
jgi:hypothetical protein